MNKTFCPPGGLSFLKGIINILHSNSYSSKFFLKFVVLLSGFFVFYWLIEKRKMISNWL
nr:MAG TPA: hypothetical protein [Caudoviricetes sp.]